MAIKQQPALTKEDFEAALVTLRMSVSEVARETGIPRHLVSHFRNYGDGLKPEQAAKLRDFLEDKGLEFTDEDEHSAPKEAGAQLQPITLPITLADDGLTQRTALVCRHFFVDERITDEQITKAGERIQESFVKAKELLEVKLTTSWGDFDEATETKIRELWGHLARIGLVSLRMQGRALIKDDRVLADDLPAGGKDKRKPETIGDLLAETYREAVAGLTGDKLIGEAPQEPAEEEQPA